MSFDWQYIDKCLSSGEDARTLFEQLSELHDPYSESEFQDGLSKIGESLVRCCRQLDDLRTMLNLPTDKATQLDDAASKCSESLKCVKTMLHTSQSEISSTDSQYGDEQENEPGADSKPYSPPEPTADIHRAAEPEKPVTKKESKRVKTKESTDELVHRLLGEPIAQQATQILRETIEPQQPVVIRRARIVESTINESALYDFEHFCELLSGNVDDVKRKMNQIGKLDRDELYYMSRMLTEAINKIKNKYMTQAEQRTTEAITETDKNFASFVHELVSRLGDSIGVDEIMKYAKQHQIALTQRDALTVGSKLANSIYYSFHDIESYLLQELAALYKKISQG